MKMDPTSPSLPINIWGPVRIAGVYLALGALWILFSDRVAASLAPNEAVFARISLYKGWGYILATSLLLYWMIRQHTRQMSKAERTLHEQEENYQELLDQASDGIFIADSKGQYIVVNEEACRLVGYTREELLSMNLRELVAPEEMEKTILRFDELQTDKSVIFERKFIRKDESPILCEISAKRLPDGRYQSIMRDITERKVTEDALMRSEKRYRSLFENMSSGFARCQMLYDENEKPCDFIYLDINEPFKKMTGLEDVIGRRVTEVIPGIRESNPEIFEIYGRVALTGKPEKFEAFVPTLGTGIWFSISVYSQEKGFFVAVFEIITERKLAETALRESEERLRLSLYAAKQGLYDLNVQTGNAIVNREYAEMLGYNPDTFIETNAAWIERLHPDDREITAKAYSDYINGLKPEYRVEFRQRTNDGNWKWILSLGKVVEYDAEGKPLRMLGTHTDITERKQAEETIQIKDRLLHITSQMAKVGGWEFNTKTLAGTWTDQVARIHDLDPRQETNVELGVSFYVGESRKKIEDAIKESIELGKPYDLELEMVSAKGSHKWVRTMGLPIMDDGKAVKIQGIFQDITERKQSEDEIRRLNEELEQRVIERTSQLEAANKELEAFSYSVSHDLRAPLRAIDGYTRILVEDYESSLDEEGKRVCNVISHEARRMGQLIDDLLSFSRLGRREMHPSEIDMKALASTVFGELMKQEDGRNIDFQIRELHKAAGDAVLIRQVWVNLLSNAIKFTSGMKRAVIEVGSTQNKDEIVYYVRDNGAGFDMEYVSKLFGVFQRLHSESEFEGTGVGLAIVQRLIHRHDGRVWAEGKVNEGATFHFALPRKENG